MFRYILAQEGVHCLALGMAGHPSNLSLSLVKFSPAVALRPQPPFLGCSAAEVDHLFPNSWCFCPKWKG